MRSTVQHEVEFMSPYPHIQELQDEEHFDVPVSDGYNVSTPKPFIIVLSKEGDALPIAEQIGESGGFEVGYFQSLGAASGEHGPGVTSLESWRPVVGRASFIVTDDPALWFKARAICATVLFYGNLDHVMVNLTDLLSGGFELRKRPWWKVWGK